MNLLYLSIKQDKFWKYNHIHISFILHRKSFHKSRFLWAFQNHFHMPALPYHGEQSYLSWKQELKSLHKMRFYKLIILSGSLGRSSCISSLSDRMGIFPENWIGWKNRVRWSLPSRWQISKGKENYFAMDCKQWF